MQKSCTKAGGDRNRAGVYKVLQGGFGKKEQFYGAWAGDCERASGTDAGGDKGGASGRSIFGDSEVCFM